MPHFLMFENFEMPHFSQFQNQIGKMGHFKILARDQFLNRKGTENGIIRFLGNSKFYANAIT